MWCAVFRINSWSVLSNKWFWILGYMVNGCSCLKNKNTTVGCPRKVKMTTARARAPNYTFREQQILLRFDTKRIESLMQRNWRVGKRWPMSSILIQPSAKGAWRQASDLEMRQLEVEVKQQILNLNTKMMKYNAELHKIKMKYYAPKLKSLQWVG